MTSISTTAATSAEGDVPVPADELVVDKNQKRSTRTSKGRGAAVAAQASAKPAMERSTGADEDDGAAMADKPAASGAAKKDVVLKKLRTSRGTTIEALMQATAGRRIRCAAFCLALCARSSGSRW